MPVTKYDKWFGGGRGNAGKAKRAMAKHYGAQEGERVFYATMNKRKNEGKAGGVVGALRKHRKRVPNKPAKRRITHR